MFRLRGNMINPSSAADKATEGRPDDGSAPPPPQCSEPRNYPQSGFNTDRLDPLKQNKERNEVNKALMEGLRPIFVAPGDTLETAQSDPSRRGRGDVVHHLRTGSEGSVYPNGPTLLPMSRKPAGGWCHRLLGCLENTSPELLLIN